MSMEFKSKLVKGRAVSGQSREIISNVLTFMKRECEAGEPIISLKSVFERVAAATGVSERTITRISSEQKIISQGNFF